MEERQLIKECVRGESYAWKIMYELHAPAMMSVCLRYIANRETAQDLLQEGFVRLFTKIHTYSGAGSFKGWMRRIFVTTALEHLRRNNVLRYSIDVEVADDVLDDVEVSIFEHLTADDLLTCVTILPDMYRIVFNMHAIEGYTHVEIAKKLGINENTSRTYYAKARRLLQKTVMKKVENLELKMENFRYDKQL